MYSHPPLSQRVCCTKEVEAGTDGTKSESRGKYRNWGETQLINAMVAVENGIPLRRAAEMYSVPKSTLYDHTSGKVAFGARSGPDPYLSTEEEEELCSFLIQVGKIGYPHTKKQVLALVQQMLSSKGVTSIVSNGWWERFCQRNPGITLRSAVPLSLARAAATDPEMLSRYYDTLEECLRNNEILDDPNAIYNCDETGLPLNPAALRVVQEVGTKNPSFVTGGDKSQVTVLACTSAAGQLIPPFIIFDRITWNTKLAESEIPGSLYGLSKKGWMNSELFHNWFENHFLKYIPQTRPIILLLDGHSSHYSPEFIKLAAEEGVAVFVLPPNTTHLTQPLDKGCFSPLKVAWRQACHEYRTRYPGRVVTRLDFNQVFSEAWYIAMRPHNIIASYKTTGICPFNKHALKIPGMEKKEFTLFRPESVVARSGLKYVPLYSPSHRRHPSDTSSEVASPCTPVSTSLHPKPLARLYLDVPLSERFSRAASVPLRSSTTISNFLNPPIPPSKIPTRKEKSSGHCLTSKEGLQKCQEKQREKEEKEKLTLEREKNRELKAEAKRLQQKKTADKAKQKLPQRQVLKNDSADEEISGLYDQSDDNSDGDMTSAPEKAKAGRYTTRGKMQKGTNKTDPDSGGDITSAPEKAKAGKYTTRGKVQKGKNKIVPGSTEEADSDGDTTSVPEKAKAGRYTTRGKVKNKIVPGSAIEADSDGDMTSVPEKAKVGRYTTRGKVQNKIVPGSAIEADSDGAPEKAKAGRYTTHGKVQKGKNKIVPGSTEEADSDGRYTTRGKVQNKIVPGSAIEADSDGDMTSAPEKAKAGRYTTRGKVQKGKNKIVPGSTEEADSDGDITSAPNKAKAGFSRRGKMRKGTNKTDPGSTEEAGDTAPEKAMAGFSRYTSCGKVQKGTSKTDPGSDEGGTDSVTSEVCSSWYTIKKVQRSSSKTGPGNAEDLKSWVKSLSLTKFDENILNNGKNLTANHICSGQILLKRLYPSHQGLHDTCYLSAKLVWPSKPLNFVQVIHVGQNHWACLSNKFCNSNEVELFDSFSGPDTPDYSIIRQACAILHSENKSMTIHLVDTHQQVGSGECGLYALAYATDLCSGIDPSTLIYFQSRMRSHLRECFTRERMSSFPSRKVARKRARRSFVIDVYCLCRQPEELPMAWCDGCHEWFHSNCMDIPEDVFSDSYKNKWYCADCAGLNCSD